MTARVLLPAILMVLYLFAARASADTIAIDSSAVVLDQADPQRRIVGALQYVAGFELKVAANRSGGLSGAVLSPDGSALLAVSDRGFWVQFGLLHDDQGHLVGIGGKAELLPLTDRSGRPLAGLRTHDAEAVTRSAEGDLIVAFQDDDRLWRYHNPPVAAAKPMPGPRGLGRVKDDEGVSALTTMPDDQLIMLTEKDFNRTGDVRGWLRRGGRWSEIGWVPAGAYRPSDMATLPNGDILLLSRRFSTYDGFSVRLSVIDAGRIKPLARLLDREIGVLKAPLAVDNFEAVAVRPASDGSTLVYLLSDDRRSPLQRTLLLQFRLPEELDWR